MKRIPFVLLHLFLVLFVTATVIPICFHGIENLYPCACMISVFMVLLLTKFKTLGNLKFSQLFALGLCCFSFLVALLNSNSLEAFAAIKEYFLYFMIAGFGSLLIVNYKYYFEFFLRCMIVIALVVSPIIINNNLYSTHDEVHNKEWMAAIYAITPYLVSSIFYLFIGEKKLFKALSIACLVVYFRTLIMHTPRGVVVTIIVSIIVLCIQKYIKKGRSTRALYVWGGIFCIASMFAVDTLLNLLIYLANQFDLRWLSKFVLEEDISNNRYVLYQEAWKGFLNSPVWGNGVAAFHNYEIYPHNLFLQMMYETGLLMIIPVLYILYYAMKIIMSCKNLYGCDYRFVTFFFLISINQLMFSSYFWRNISFWLLIWTVIFILHKKTLVTLVDEY